MFGKNLKEAGGQDITVIDPGRLNTDAGPDFFNSKVRIGDTEWAGNVEIHVKASDWYRHGHQHDPAYDSIILHVVGVSDRRVTRSDGSIIPQVEITLPENFFRTYSHLSLNADDIRCGDFLHDLPSLTLTDWLETLAVERLQAKAMKAYEICKTCGMDWEQTCFVVLARAFGFGLNGDPFELLARSVALKILHHHSDNPLQIQAILFGQAAMLDSSLHIFDEYYQYLCREYYFLARKYGLRPMRPGQWKYSHTRPQNFPHRRIAFLAKACEGGFALLSRILDCKGNEQELRKLFEWRLDGYWHDHFSFDVDARSISDTLSNTSITLLLINAVAPIIYAKGAITGDTDMMDSAFRLLSSLPPEANAITRLWQGLGMKASDAMRSQALIHLKKEYCDPRKCLYCRFGNQALKRAAT